MFLENCQQANIIPKGLRLKHQVHTIQGDGPSTTTERIETILSNAEKEMVKTLVTHYRQIAYTTTT